MPLFYAGSSISEGIQGMIQPQEFICPVCGEVLSSLTTYHRHYAKKHEVSIRDHYESGCPILEEER